MAMGTNSIDFTSSGFANVLSLIEFLAEGTREGGFESAQRGCLIGGLGRHFLLWWKLDHHQSPLIYWILNLGNGEELLLANKECYTISKPNQIEATTKKGYSTAGSQVVSNLSTDAARRCLTSQIGRDEVHSS